MIPYFIAIAHPDYKRPHTQIITRVCEEEDLFETLLLDIVEIYVGALESLDNYLTLNDLEDAYYFGYYMDQKPVEAKYFDVENGEWQDFHFSDEDFFDAYRKHFRDDNSHDE